MKIETKYNIGDAVWVMHDNKVARGSVEEISIVCRNGLKTTYIVKSESPYSQVIQRGESYVFTSKDELLKSL